MTKPMHVPADVEKLLGLLKEAGYRAYLVGGCVRDFIMNRIPHDYDITTNALPEQVMAVMEGKYQVLTTGLKHGTVTVMVEDCGFEITTFRVEGTYSDGRHPDSVEFVSDLEADLSRRDFTVNAIAYSPEEGYIDTFGGIADIETQLIRAVGDPEKRFEEDHLRILRALRFASTLSKNPHSGQFLIDPDTAKAIEKMHPLLTTVSAERITTEMNKLLGGVNVRNILINYPYVFLTLFPELEPMYHQVQHHPWHKYNLWEHVATVVANVEPKSYVLLWAAFLHDCGKPQVANSTPVEHIKLQPKKSLLPLDDYQHEDVTTFVGHAQAGAKLAETILARTALKKSHQERIVELIQEHHSFPAHNVRSVRRWKAKHPDDSFCEQLIRLRAADSSGFSAYGAAIADTEIKELYDLMGKVMDSPVPYRPSQLACKGEDIIALGVKEGPQIGLILRSLLSAVVEEKVQNEKGALLAYVRSSLL